MPFIPTFVLGLWLLGLFAIGLIGGGAYLVYEWSRRAWEFDPDLDRYRFDPDWGWNGETALLAAGVALLIWTFAGGQIVRLVLHLGSGRRDAGGDGPGHEHGGEVRRLQRPDGAELQVELSGPEDGTPIILTHGWGANSNEWNDLRRQLSPRFRLIAWDLPGLGKSRKPDTDDYSLENLARHLEAVLALAGDRPAVLVGHSIGGMITLTFCSLFPAALGPRVAKLVLVHTTCTNPVRTTRHAAFYAALEKPVLVPLLHLTIALWPLVWLMTWLSYLNGATHLSTRRQSFAGTQTAGQIDFTARFLPHGSPAVLARGMFGMLHFDATETLATIPIPTLVIPGDRDPVCTPEASERIRRGVKGARLVALEPARHMGLIEHHEQFGELIERFAAAGGDPGPKRRRDRGGRRRRGRRR